MCSGGYLNSFFFVDYVMYRVFDSSQFVDGLLLVLCGVYSLLFSCVRLLPLTLVPDFFDNQMNVYRFIQYHGFCFFKFS